MFNSKKDYWIEFYNHTHDDFREIKDECSNIIGSGNDFVEFMVSGKADNFYRDSVKIFSLFETLSIFLMVLVVFTIFIV